MKKGFVLLIFIFITLLSKGQQYIASNHMSGTGDVAPEGLISDGLQNTYISGFYKDNFTHDGQVAPFKGEYDIFLAKYNDDQEEDWFVSIGSTGLDGTTKLAFASDGNIFIAGTCSANCEFGSTDGNTETLEFSTSSDGRNIFLAKYNANTGALMWAEIIVAGFGTQALYSLAVDETGNVLIGGNTVGIASFPTSTANAGLQATTAFVAKFDSEGKYLWNTTILQSPVTTTTMPIITGIVAYADHYVFAGYPQNQFTLTDALENSQIVTPASTTVGKQYIITASIGLDGKLGWIKHSDAPTNTTVGQLVKDESGTLFLSGLFATSNSTDFKYDGAPVGLVRNGTGSDIYVFSLNSNGDLIHANSGGSPTSDYIYGIQIKNNLLYIAGNLGSGITLPGNRKLDPGIFVAAYTIATDKSFTLIDALEGAKAFDAKGVVFSPKSFKLMGAFYTSPLYIGDSIFINPNTATRDLYMSKACPIVGITPTVTNVTGCDVTAKNGSISLAVAGDAGPYTYQWEKEGSGIIKGQTQPTISGLDTGRYVATVLFNSQYCSKSANVTVTAPGALSITTLDVTHAACDQLPASTGTIQVSTSPAADATTQFKAVGTVPGNPTPVYTVEWTINGGDANFNNYTFANCPPGQYEISVKNGTCETKKQTALAALASDGSIGIQVQDYTCNLHNLADTVGMVKATVDVDRTGKNVWFMLADAVTGATVQSTSQGKGEVTADGSVCEFDKVLPGQYVVTTGEIGTQCMIESSEINIANPPVVTISSVKDADVLCSGTATGRISVTAKGGVLDGEGKSTLSYILNYADDTPTNVKPDPRPTAVYFDNLAAGLYNVIVKDQAGCTDSVRNVDLSDLNEPITVVMDGLPYAACYGQNNGSVKLVASGGVHPDETTTYTYTLTSGGNSYQNASGNFEKNLPAASYTATVTEHTTKCKVPGPSVIIKSLDQLTFSDPAHENVKCKDGNSGTISIATITGGTGTYTASLTKENIPVGSDTEAPYKFEDLYKGDYMVSVVDDYGCTAVASKQVVITEPATAVSLVVTGSSNVTCPGFLNGSITVEASGGTITTQTSYAYELYLGGELEAGPQPENVFSNIPAGNYTIKAIDANGCEAFAARNVTEPPTSMTYTIAQVDAKCFGSEDGSITITITSSTTGTLYYTLTDAKGNPIKDSSPIPSFSGLKAGTYRIQVYEGANCGQLTEAIVIGQPEKLQIVSIETTPTSCRIPADGTATVTVSGGTGPYTYGCCELTGVTTPDLSHTFTGLDNSTHHAFVVDDNGCETGDKDFTVAITPNPSLTAAQSKLTGCNEKSSIGVISAAATAATGGSDVFQYKLGESGTLQTSADFGTLTAGDYTVIVVDGNACQAKVENVAVRAAYNPVATVTGSNIKCYTDKGSLTTTVDVETDLDGTEGSVISYQFDMNGEHFSDPGPSGDLSNLSPGEYTVHVVDSYSCQGEGSTTIAAPSEPLGLDVTATDAYGSTKGSITAQPKGGWLQYTITCYQVTMAGDVEKGVQTGDGSKSYTFQNLEVGTYKVIVVDTEGCMSYKLQDIKMATGELDLDAPSLKIFPNPSSDGRFIIEWDTKEDRKVTLEVYNMSGQLVYKTNVQTGIGGARTSLDISKQSRGTYLLRVPELEIKQKLVIQ